MHQEQRLYLFILKAVVDKIRDTKLVRLGNVVDAEKLKDEVETGWMLLGVGYKLYPGCNSPQMRVCLV